LSRGFDKASCPAKPLVSYQTDRLLPGWILPPLVIRALGAHDLRCKRPGQAEAHTVVHDGEPEALGGAEEPRIGEPGTAADNAATATTSRCPRRTASRRPIVAVVITIRRPLPCISRRDVRHVARQDVVDAVKRVAVAGEEEEERCVARNGVYP
jgi:hypothetical protein